MSDIHSKQTLPFEIIEKLHSIDFFMIFLTCVLSFDLFIVYFYDMNILSLSVNKIVELPSMMIFFLIIYGAIMTVILPLLNYFINFALIKILPSDHRPSIHSEVNVCHLKEFAHTNKDQYLFSIYSENRKSKEYAANISKLAFNSTILVAFNYSFSFFSTKETLTMVLVQYDNMKPIGVLCAIAVIFLVYLWLAIFKDLHEYDYIYSQALASQVNQKLIAEQSSARRT